MADPTTCGWHGTPLVERATGLICPTCEIVRQRIIELYREADTCTDPVNVRLRRWAMAPNADGPHILMDAATLLEAQQTELEQLRAALNNERALADRLAQALCQAVNCSCCTDNHPVPCDQQLDDVHISHGAPKAVITAWRNARSD